MIALFIYNYIVSYSISGEDWIRAYGAYSSTWSNPNSSFVCFHHSLKASHLKEYILRSGIGLWVSLMRSLAPDVHTFVADIPAL